MNLAIARNEPALRLAPVGATVAAALAALHAVLLAPVLGAAGLDGEPLWDGNESFGLVYVPLAVLVVIASIGTWAVLPLRTRVLEFERALPVTMRELVLSRLAVSAVAFGAPLVSATAVYAAISPRAELATALKAGGVLLAAGALSLTFAFRWRASRVEIDRREGLGVAAVAALLFALPEVLDEPRLGLVYAALTAGLLFDLRRRLPLAIPAEDPKLPGARRPTARPDARDRARSGASLSPLTRVLVRSVALRPLSILVLGFIALLVPLVGPDNVVWLLLFPVLYILIAVRHGLAPLRALDPLPVARARLLPFLVVPSLAASIVAFGLLGVLPLPWPSFGMLAGGVQLDASSERAIGVKADYRLHVEVPASAWALGFGDGAARVTAPWGETFEPLPHPAFRGAPVFVHNPYDVGEENTVRFLAWQLARALRDVHGLELSPEEVHARWLADFELEAAIEATGDPRLPEGTPWGRLATRVPNRPGGWLLVGLLLWAGSAAYGLRDPLPPPSATRGWRRRLRPFVLPGLSFLSIVGLAYVDMADRVVRPVVAARLHRAVDQALGSSSFAWAVLLGALWLCAYLWLGRRLQRLEVPPLPLSVLTRKGIRVF